MFGTSMKIGIGIIALALAGGTVMMFEHHGKQSSIAPPTETVHTTDWYVAHPDALKADDARCGSDSASIPQTACQNAATADDRLLSQQLQQAASGNAAAAKNPTPKAP